MVVIGRSPVGAADRQPLADRIDTGQIAGRECLIHHRHGWSLEAIGRAQEPARAHSNAKRREVGRRCRGDERGRQCLAAVRATLQPELRAEGRQRRELRRRRHGADAGQRRQAIGQLLEERARRLARIAIARKRQPHREHVGRIEAAIDALDVEKAPHQQAGAQKEDHRQRELGDDERVPDEAAATRAAAYARRP